MNQQAMTTSQRAAIYLASGVIGTLCPAAVFAAPGGVQGSGDEIEAFQRGLVEITLSYTNLFNPRPGDQGLQPGSSMRRSGSLELHLSCAVPKLIIRAVTWVSVRLRDHAMIAGCVVPTGVSGHDQAVRLARATRVTTSFLVSPGGTVDYRSLTSP